MKTSSELPTRAQLRVSQIKITYLGPQEKPIPSLIAFSQIQRLSEIGLTNLVAKGLPKDVSILLSSLVGREYSARADFRADLEKALGKELFLKHGGPVIGEATQTLGQELVLENFSTIQRNKGIYGGDRSPYTKVFGATPEELRKVVVGFVSKMGKDRSTKETAMFSFAIIFKPTTAQDRQEYQVSGSEFLLSLEEGRMLFSEFAASLDSENSPGKKSVQEMSDMFF